MMIDKTARIEQRKQELYQLTSEAGILDWISGWWDSRKGARDLRSLRKNMQRFCKEINKDFKDLEDHLTSRDPNGVAKAAALASRLSIQFLNLFVGDMDSYLELYDKMYPSPPKPPPAPEAPSWDTIEENIKSTQNTARAILEKADKFNPPLNPNEKSKIDELSNRLETKMVALHMLRDQSKSESLKKEILSIYTQLRSVMDATGITEKSVTSQHAAEFSEEIAKIAHNVITRWINRKLMGINPSKEDMMKLRCVSSMHKATISSKKIISILRGSGNVKSAANDFYDDISTVLLGMAALAKDYTVMQQTRKGKEVIRLTNKVGSSLERVANQISNRKYD